MRETCEKALEDAVAAGAAYADARAVTRRSQNVSTKNRAVDSVSDSESEGIGVRVLVDGAWGFACDPRLSPEGAREAAGRAVAFARASARNAAQRVELAPAPALEGEYRTAFTRDPIEVSLEEKIGVCLAAEEELARPGIEISGAAVRARREQRAFASTEGTRLFQEIVECGGGIDALAVGDGRVQTRSFPSSHGGSSAQGGWEYVESLGLEREAPRVADEALALLQAEACPSGVTTVVLDAEQMQLQMHESVGHPTELDRIYGTEAAYAGTSWVSAADLGSLRYGSELMNVTADATTAGGLGTFGWDDEGVAARREPVVSRGRPRRVPQLTRDRRRRLDARRQLEPHAARADDEPPPRAGRGIARRSARRRRRRDLPRDEQELVDRRPAAELPVRDRDRLGDQERQARPDAPRRDLHRRDARRSGPRSTASPGRRNGGMHGLTNCGKGQPGQHAHVSHGAAPARFRNVQVGVRS